ncbi:GNAT family N-acetyltransferase [Chryseobacterium turcicum]|uniref:GNAT family N-acetyltransferase n=1 Tax=Chryseobacterium turcicum TaxID=2898076 RepID=A0A9Q3V3W8_9FLAO|nr:GNAT family N-acetyltransferase [Chryseobacterium turcicum]MCD1119163.1 GNAT family N-acetyltransferase [Chryseobacterium turcicum]
MIIGTHQERDIAIDILCKSFYNVLIPNSINFVVNENGNRYKKLKALMSYQVDLSLLYGKVFLSNDRKGVILFLDNPPQSLKRFYLELKLIFKCIGISNVFKVLKLENLLKKNHPEHEYIHLWLMGVIPEMQGKGAGSQLLNESLQQFRDDFIFVETTTTENLNFYQKNGFAIFNETHQLDYPLYFLKNV